MLKMTDPRLAGHFIHPAENGNIYGWNIVTDDGSIVARMTACDLDLEIQRERGAQMIDAFNAAQTASVRGDE